MINYAFDPDNVLYVENLLEEFHRDAQSVPGVWQRMFRELGNGNEQALLHRRFSPRTVFNPPPLTAEGAPLNAARLQDRVDQLIRAYRVRGHLIAKLDPLGFVRPEPAELALETYRLSPADLDRPCSTTSIGGPSTQTLRDIVQRLRGTYCRHLGVQFMHIDDLDLRTWLCERMERTENRLPLSRDDQRRILTRLTDAVMFEQFVRKKYPGAKTFSLEGAESLIPLLDLAIEKAARQGIDDIVLGMAHRGRLNVLVNIIGKTPREIFWEFNDPEREGPRRGGDVKHHLGFSGQWRAACGRVVHLSLCFNPSHLEFVNPVALGRMRARQDRRGDYQRQRGMTLLIHGDAAFAGEGIVQESLNLSQLSGYHVGGTLHVIVNNQIGFTTSPEEGRSPLYATDVARMLQIPIFHVNGEAPEAVAQAVDLALDFRRRFRRDVVIDMYGYRRWGHNEGDEPSFTQPLRCQAIERRVSVREGYLDHLLGVDGMARAEADRIAEQRHEHLEGEFHRARQADFAPRPRRWPSVWDGYCGGREPEENELQTGVEAERLSALLVKLAQTPDDFHRHPKLRRSTERRRQMAAGQQSLDWSAAEALAFATLAVEGHPVRLTGQDAARGTFSHRHAVLHDIVDGHTYEIFQHLAAAAGDSRDASVPAPVEIINSPLCEAADLGFQYGYSLDCPQALVAWEAQFGDFANAAQVLIDQFLASAENKWQRLSGLVLLLPHGLEGQGPEHSSARLERFLSLAAEHNLQVVCPSTPAQYYHVLRRQVKRGWRKPLVVLTPKSLLRHPRVVSPLKDLACGSFQRVLPDDRPACAGELPATARVVLCCGKIYFELLQAREGTQRGDVAILRVEQLYPLPEVQLRAALAPYAEDVPVVWVQEEPENMGAWRFWRSWFGERLFGRFPLGGVTREASASPATGSSAAHQQEQRELLQRALSIVGRDADPHGAEY